MTSAASVSPSGGAASELVLSIGGLVGYFQLGAAPPLFLQQLKDRYGPYAVPSAQWVTRAFSLTVSFGTPTHTGPRVHEMADHPLRVEESSGAVRATRWDFAARVEAPVASGPRGWEGTATCEMNPFAFDSMLRVLWAVFLPRSGGGLFHACAFRVGDTGVIFPGVSGTGKSTLARKVPEPERILTDELVAVSRGELGHWRITGTPFWGDFKRGGGSIRSWPLGAIAFLEQSEELSVRPLSPSEGAWRLLACFLCFQTDADTAARNLAIAIDLCDDVQSVAARTARETPLQALEAELSPYLPKPKRSDHPPTSREMISEFRWLLQQTGQYAYKPRGTSMKPWLRPGDSLFIQRVDEAALSPGDVVLYWTPGRTPHEDHLTCHRMVARRSSSRTSGDGLPRVKYFMKGDARSTIERFENGRESEILGRVSAVSRDDRAVPMPGRLGALARLLGSLVATPLLRATGR